HRALARCLRIELGEAVLVAEVLHDRAALPERSLRQALLLEHRREVRRVLLEELRRRRLPPDIELFEVEPGGPDEDPSRQVVDARLEHVQRDGGHVVLRSTRFSIASARWISAILGSSRSTRSLWASTSTSVCVKPAGGSKR